MLVGGAWYPLAAATSDLQELPKIADPWLVSPPTRDRALVNRLPRLPSACGFHKIVVSSGRSTPNPIRARRMRSAFGPCSPDRAHIFVVEIEKSVGWDYRAPVLHETQVQLIARRQVTERARKPQAFPTRVV
jgi:hypothetical protein